MKRNLSGWLVVFCAMWLSVAAAGQDKTPVQDKTPAQDKPVLVVHTFSAASNVAWPYDMKQLQTQTVAELKAKEGQHLNVVPDSATGGGHIYTLDAEVTSWHAGNRAKRVLVGMGSGRESADIHYWLTDEKGAKVFDHKDTIRAEFWGNAYEGSVGQLAHPFADKIAKRLADAKLF